MREQLTQRQAQILDFVVEQLAAGSPPTVAEVAAEFDVSPQSASKHIDALVTKGWLERSAKHRSVDATDKAWRRALLAEEKRAGRRAGGVGARTAVLVRMATRGVQPSQRQGLLEFALARATN